MGDMNPNCPNGDSKRHKSEDQITASEREDEDEELKAIPKVHSVTKEEENLREFACDLIQNAGILLKLPQVALTTAQMLLQRVYHTAEYTFDKHCLDITTMACLFLAAKIEEYPRKARDVIDVFTHVISHKLRRELTLSLTQHKRVRAELVTTEALILKKLGFQLLSNYPHKMIVTFYHAIVNKLDQEQNIWREEDNRRVIQRAWNYCNDSLRLDVFTRFSQEAVACACVQMACEDTAKQFPESTDGRPWYCLFVPSQLEVANSIRLIRSLYDRTRVEPEKIRRFLYLGGRL